MKTLERCLWRRFKVFIVNREYISKFVVIVDFEQAIVCCVYIEKTNIGTRSGMSHYVGVFKCEQSLLTN